MNNFGRMQQYVNSESYFFLGLVLCTALLSSFAGKIAGNFMLGDSLLEFAKYSALCLFALCSSLAIGLIIVTKLPSLTYWKYAMIYMSCSTAMFTLSSIAAGALPMVSLFFFACNFIGIFMMSILVHDRG